ncbi:hypothetical protein ACHAXT_011378 [Thalassiosira profunda]
MAPRAAVAKITDADGNIYQGEWAEGKPHGRGTKTWVDGDVYEGEWKDGCHHGRGFFIFADGDVYDGEWKDNIYDGTGTFTWADGDVYSGEWRGGLEHGRGTKTWANVNMFEGKQRWSPGDSYEGEWVKGLRHGHGTRRNASGDVVYEGKWVEGFPVEKGQPNRVGGSARGGLKPSCSTSTADGGKIETPHYDNGVYEGELKNDKPHGRGVCRYANGHVYDGEWRDGKMHGKGTLKEKNGDVYDGNWVEGNQLGPGTYRWESGDVYAGEFIGGLPHGHGTMTWKASGRRFEGQWMGGKRHGKGMMRLPSGDAYEQVWSNGNHVKGWANGTVGDLTGRLSSGSNATAAVSSKELSDGRKLRSQRSQLRRLKDEKKDCEHCGVDDYHYKLRVCSGCNLALYCSAACQKKARGSHQRICNISAQLPSRDSTGLLLEYDRDKLVDLDAGLRYGTKYMDELKHLEIDLTNMGDDATIILSAKQLSSLLKAKKGALHSFFWASSLYGIYEPDITLNGLSVWREVRGLKQLRFQRVTFDVQSICDIVGEQRNTLMVLSLQWLRMSWSRAKSRRALAQAIGACRHLVKLDLTGCSLMDSDVKVLLHDLPNLRILYLRRDPNDSHEFADNTCGLIARKCSGLQELCLTYHDQLSVKGIRKIFEGCVHLRSFYTTTRKLSSEDVRSLLDTAPQLMYLSLSDKVGLSVEELDELIETTSGRTAIQLCNTDSVFDSSNISAKVREKYDHQKHALMDIWSRRRDPKVTNEWEAMLDGK